MPSTLLKIELKKMTIESDCCSIFDSFGFFFFLVFDFITYPGNWSIKPLRMRHVRPQWDPFKVLE